MSLKENVFLGGLISLGIVLIPIYIVALLGVSYLSLLAINCIVVEFPSLSIEKAEIGVGNIVIFSIFLLLIFRSSRKSNIASEEWIKKSAYMHIDAITQINQKLDVLQDIKQNSETIEMVVIDIRDKDRD